MQSSETRIIKMFIRFHLTSKIQISYHVAQKLENLMRLKRIKKNFIRHFKDTVAALDHGNFQQLRDTKRYTFKG